MMVSSYGTGVPAMAAKVTLPKDCKSSCWSKKVLKLKNNKRAAKWKVSKGKKYVKIVKKSKKSCTVKGIKGKRYRAGCNWSKEIQLQG